ncbi:MAG: DUF488 family protein [Tepidisphaeraceae bacterium]
MLKVKHLFDAAEHDDGGRLWVESVGLTKDLVEWCSVDHLLCNAAPPRKLANWYEKHPESYDQFRSQYHDFLEGSPYLAALEELATSAISENFTLLHAGDDREANTATALAEFLVEKQGWAKSK